MNHTKGERRTITAETNVPFSPREVFPLLCPVREHEWIEEWRCDVIYSESGVNELDCVFITDDEPEGREVWVTSRYEPYDRIEFVRINSERTVRYIVALTPTSHGTKITWTQFLTGLTPEGNRAVIAAAATEYTEMITALENKLAHFLSTGTALAGVDSAKGHR